MPLPKFEGSDDFEFPDEKEQKAKTKAEELDDDFDTPIKVVIEDDTPPEDRGRKPMAEPPEDHTDE